ncbi:hypothetical protein ACFV6F_20115 [Kitasatospora phosalacinea]|uniref:hypothetical protein n=1 Tax=Kitasatospora phosalacinea TaxID=2065 RepID=UPI003667B75E
MWHKYTGFLVVACALPLVAGLAGAGGFVYLLLAGSGTWQVIGLTATALVAAAGGLTALLAYLFTVGMDRWEF